MEGWGYSSLTQARRNSLTHPEDLLASVLVIRAEFLEITLFI